jgi:hypothetical protein
MNLQRLKISMCALPLFVHIVSAEIADAVSSIAIGSLCVAGYRFCMFRSRPATFALYHRQCQHLRVALPQYRLCNSCYLPLLHVL